MRMYNKDGHNAEHYGVKRRDEINLIGIKYSGEPEVYHTDIVKTLLILLLRL